MTNKPEELFALVQVLSSWADSIPCIKTLYLFGSHVRGDNGPDSDVDVHVEFDFGKPSESFGPWYRENDDEFRQINSKLPGPLALHQEKDDAIVPRMLRAAANPKLVFRKVVCVEMEPSPFPKAPRKPHR